MKMMNNKKIIDYTIIEVKDTDSLVDEVNELIESGWQPYGALIVTKNELFDEDSSQFGNTNWYTQALVMYEE